MRLPATLLILCLAALPGCMAMRFVPAGAGVRGETSSEVEVVRFPTTGGLTLEGRLYPAECDRPDRPARRGGYARLPDQYARSIILHCHGVADNNTSAMASFLGDAGFRIFKFDYRGFGHSDPGPFTNRGFAEDAIAALAYLRTRPDVDPGRILVYGHSMGGVYAMAAAADAAKRGQPVRAVITASTFSSWRRVGHHHAPVIGYLLGGVTGPSPLDYLRDLGGTPLLIAHAADDGDVPVENAYRLHAAARDAGVEATLHIAPRGGHVFAYWDAGPFAEMMTRFALMHLGDDPSPHARARGGAE